MSLSKAQAPRRFWLAAKAARSGPLLCKCNVFAEGQKPAHRRQDVVLYCTAEQSSTLPCGLSAASTDRRVIKLEEEASKHQEAAAAAALRAANAEGKVEMLQKALQKAEERATTLEMQACAGKPAPILLLVGRSLRACIYTSVSHSLAGDVDGTCAPCPALSGVCLAQKLRSCKSACDRHLTELLPRADAVALGRGNAGRWRGRPGGRGRRPEPPGEISGREVTHPVV